MPSASHENLLQRAGLTGKTTRVHSRRESGELTREGGYRIVEPHPTRPERLIQRWTGGFQDQPRPDRIIPGLP